MIDLNQSAVFAAVARHGSFTKAARALALPKSTVSKKVTDLERRMGVTLLKRTTRKISLTESGSEYYAACSRALGELEEAEGSATRGQTTPHGTLRVTAPAEMGSFVLPEIVRAFHLKHPEVRLELILDDRVLDLVEDRIDLAIRGGRLPDSSLVAVKLMSGEFQLMASPAYLKERGTPASPTDLIHHTFLRYTGRQSSAPWVLERGRGRFELTFHGSIQATQLAAIKQLALAGLGVALVPQFVCRAELRSGRLVRVLPDWCSARGPIYAVYPRQRFVPAKTRTFLEFLKAGMAKAAEE